jgi:hypothetical protein
MKDALDNLLPVKELDQLGCQGVCDWFNKHRADSQRVLMLSLPAYCRAREAGDEREIESILTALYDAWVLVQDSIALEIAYKARRVRAGRWGNTSADKAFGKARLEEKKHQKRLAEAEARVARANERHLAIAARQLGSRGGVVQVNTGNVEYRLKDKRWRERSDRFRDR